MRINSLTSAANSLLKKIRSLHERQARHKAGLFLLEGEKLLLEAVARGIEIEAVVLETEYFQKGISQALEFVLADHQYFPEGINLAPPSLFKDLITTTTSCGLIAAARCRTASLDQLLSTDANKGGHSTVIILEAVQDPGNLGSIMRSALAFCAAGLILGRGTVDLYNPKVVRSAMGALFDLPIVEGADLTETVSALKQAGFTVCSLNPEAPKALTDPATPAWEGKVAFLLGNEGAGLSAQVSALADFDLRIDMSNQIESLNVSIAAAIVLFHRYNVAKGI